MTTATGIDWTDVGEAARLLAGNWRKFDCFCWHRGYDLPDAEQWAIWYTSHPGSGLLAESNEAAINQRLARFAEGDDPDVVFETHAHWAVNRLTGFSLRVYRDDGSITPAFKEFCSIKEQLEDCGALDEAESLCENARIRNAAG